MTKPKTILDALASRRVLVSDGAWGTMLQKKGLKAGECPDQWCVTHRDEVLAVAREYVAAGADMIKTNSFGGTSFKLEHYGLANQVPEINHSAAAISREAAGRDMWVIASVGPTGKMLVNGDVTEQELFDAFQEQALALAEGGADAILVETMTADDEAAIAVRAARQATDCEVICTFTFDKTAQGGYRTMMGVSPEDAVFAVLSAGAHIVGTNCGNGMAGMVEIVREIRKATKDTPILVHANAGLPRTEKGKTVYPDTPGEMARLTPALIEAGANIIGGCCGTTPAHVRAIRKAVDSVLAGQ